MRSRYSAELVRAAMSLTDARQRAEKILPNADELWLTRVGLQQATSWQVAQHKAKRFPRDEDIVDLCSGIGVDTAALLQRGSVTSIDNDAAMSHRCAWNNEVWRAESKNPSTLHTLVDDARIVNVKGKRLHADPDRRVGREKATKRLEHYTPDLNWMQAVITSAKGGAIKLGPASNFIGKFRDCEIELVSLLGECREATVWFGELAGESTYRATCLPSGETIAGNPLAAWCPSATEVGQFLLDPDPAIVRSGLLDTIGEMHSLRRLDKEEEYMTCDKLPNTSFVTSYLVEACLPNNFRFVKKHLQGDGSRDYEVKCRRIPVNANDVQRRLPRGDGAIRTIFLLRINGRARIVIARRATNGWSSE